MERSVIAEDRAIAQIQALAAHFGPGRVVWRYDPIVWSDLTPPSWHRRTVARLARALAGVTDECTTSALQPYAKTKRNIDVAARHHGFTWRDPPNVEKAALLADLAAIVAAEDMRLTLCAQPTLGDIAGAEPARCIDADRLGRVAGRPLTAPTKGNRPGCLCHASRDIGGYDSCPHGCVYCYAVRNRRHAAVRYRTHDPNSPLLLNG